MTDQDKLEVMDALCRGQKIQQECYTRTIVGDKSVPCFFWADVDPSKVHQAIRDSEEFATGSYVHKAIRIRVRPEPRECRVVWGDDGKPRIANEEDPQYVNGARVVENVNTIIPELVQKSQ